MNIYVNDELINVGIGTTIVGLLNSMDITSFHGIAFGIDNRVIPRNEWETTQLKENDKILLIRASQGG